MVHRSITFLGYGILVTLAFLLSFRAFAPYLTPDLNSDGAIHVLMTYDLKLPEDLYYWGQNRLGSLLPILSHFLLKISSFSPIKAVSYVQYALLLVGFFCIASLFKETASRIIFAIAWFLPFPDFTALIGISQPYGPQFALIGITIVLINQIREESKAIGRIKNQVLISVAVVCLFISLWISEPSLITILIFLGVATYQVFKHDLKVLIRKGSELIEATVAIKREDFVPLAITILNVGITSLAGISFILYAKQKSPYKTNYAAFSNVEQTIEVIGKLLTSFIHTITFQVYNPLITIHTLLIFVLLFGLAYVIPRQLKQGTNPFESKWLVLFFANAILSFIALIFSKWVYLNGASLRYFVVVYVSCWIAILLLVEGLEGITKRLMYVLLSLIVISSSLSLPAYVFAMTPPVSKVSQLQEVKALGKVGLIGEYWRSYVLCTVKPKLLNCTSYDPRGKTPCEFPLPQRQKIRGVRCPRCARRTVKAETIYLVKDGWFETFPAEIQQFGQCLLKVGEARQVAGYTMAPYKRYKEGAAGAKQP